MITSHKNKDENSHKRTTKITSMKKIREIITKKLTKDLKGMVIPKGTRLFVMKEGPVAPFGDHHRVLLVRVDNGTGMLDLMPETAVRDTEIM